MLIASPMCIFMLWILPTPAFCRRGSDPFFHSAESRWSRKECKGWQKSKTKHTQKRRRRKEESVAHWLGWGVGGSSLFCTVDPCVTNCTCRISLPEKVCCTHTPEVLHGSIVMRAWGDSRRSCLCFVLTSAVEPSCSWHRWLGLLNYFFLMETCLARTHKQREGVGAQKMTRKHYDKDY